MKSLKIKDAKLVELFSILRWPFRRHAFIVSISMSTCIYIYMKVFLIMEALEWCLFIPLFFFSYFCADIMSGVFHWVGDTIGNEDTPIFGKLFIAPFRKHHLIQESMTEVSVWENLGMSFLLVFGPQLALTIFINIVDFNFYWIIFTQFFNSFLLLTALTNLFHRWAHLDRKQLHPVIQFLQNKNIILNPTHHREHHVYPYRKNFCVTNGWANRILLKLRFWNVLEYIFVRIDFVFKTKIIDIQGHK